MERFFQLLIAGIETGSIYSLVALAIVLIYQSTGLKNFGQGEMAMFSAYLAWQLWAWGLGIWLAALISIFLSFLIGMSIQRVIIRPVQKAPLLTIVIVTLGLFLGFNSLAGSIWGYLVKSFPSLFPGSAWQITDGVRISAAAAGTFAVLLVLGGSLFLMFRVTKVGLAMRAVAYNMETSKLVGIKVNMILMLGWGLAAALGGAAGIFAAPKLFLDPFMMFGVLIYAIAAAAFGGFDSPLGAVLAGLIIGVVENMAGSYIGFIGTDLKILVPLFLILVTLIFRPQGLLGHKHVVRV
jgi:branched-chain amino acid transport system permease protein